MRFYKFLLLLYPTAFRTEYEEELSSIFRHRRREVSGQLDVLFLWCNEFFDIFRNAIRAHMDIFRRDFRFALRTVTRTPGFAVTAILVTALGIGANTAVFSILNHVLIRPFPYPDSARIVRLYEKSSGGGYTELSPPNYRDMKERSKSFTGMAVYTHTSRNLVNNSNAERIEGIAATADLFPLLGTSPLFGRIYMPHEDRDGAPGTVLLSYGLWQSRFAGDYRILGKTIRLDDESYNVIGIMPGTFTFPARNVDFWVPMRFQEEDFEDRDNNYLHGVAKLKPGTSLEQARAEMDLLAKDLEREYPVENAKTGVLVQTLRDSVSRQARLLLGALFGASLCLLLIACTNVANLYLVRAIGRRKELTVRAALGAGREQLMRQLLTESLLLAFAGAVLGIFLADVGVPLLSKLIPQNLPAGEATVLDWRVIGFAAALLCVTAIVFGVIPPLRMFSRTGTDALRETPRSVMGDRKERLRSVLVAAEVTACVVLLVCGGLLIRAIWKVQRIDPGFKSENVWTMQTALPFPMYEKTARRVDFYTRVLTELRSQPHVSNAAYISFLPMVMRGGIWPILPEGGKDPDPGNAEYASLRFVTPGFFQTLDIPLRLGRDVSESDTEEAPKVAVVSESFVTKYWPGYRGNPLGRRFFIAFQDRTIVGLVKDIRVRGLERNSEPQVYLPYKQVPDGALIFYAPKALVVRTKGNYDSAPQDLVRGMVQRIDPQVPVSDVQTMQEIVEGETASRKTQIHVIGLFAILSLLLAGVGIHGLLAFAVSQRLPEIGLRMAIGATSRDILKIVLLKGVRVAATGALLGVAFAYIAARAMEALLAGVQPADPAAFVSALAVAVLMTLSGCLLPAWKALGVDPAAVMRNE